jgi:hypothetical protein
MKFNDYMHDPGCTHTAKHHKQSGRCVGDCKCRYAARKAARKLARKVVNTNAILANEGAE